MPKRRSEYKNLGQAERELAIVDSVRELGIASIDDVVNYLSEKFELNLSDTNAHSAFKKSVRIFLRKKAGQTFSVSYYSKEKDSPRRLEIDELEKDDSGNIKNKYRIKYSILGTDFPGGKTLLNLGGKLSSEYDIDGNSIIDWSFSKFNKIESKKVYFILKDYRGLSYSLCCSAEDRPLTLFLGYKSEKIEKLRGLIPSNRFSVLFWPDSTLERVAHSYIKIERDLSISVKDLSSTNGSYYCEGDEEDIFNAIQQVHVAEIVNGKYLQISNTEQYDSDEERIENSLKSNSDEIVLTDAEGRPTPMKVKERNWTYFKKLKINHKKMVPEEVASIVCNFPSKSISRPVHLKFANFLVSVFITE